MFVKLINHLSAVLLIVLIMSSNSYCAQGGYLNLSHLRQVDQDLITASRNNNLDQMRIAIDNGADVNAQDNLKIPP